MVRESLKLSWIFSFQFYFCLSSQSISVCVYSIIIFWFYIDSPLSSVHPHRPPKRHVTLRTWPLTAPNNWSIMDPTEIRFDPNRFLWISKLKSRGFAIKISHLYDSFLFNKKRVQRYFCKFIGESFQRLIDLIIVITPFVLCSIEKLL